MPEDYEFRLDDYEEIEKELFGDDSEKSETKELDEYEGERLDSIEVQGFDEPDIEEVEKIHEPEVDDIGNTEVALYCKRFTDKELQRLSDLTSVKEVKDGTGTTRQMVSDKEAKMIILLCDQNVPESIHWEAKIHLFDRKWRDYIIGMSRSKVKERMAFHGYDYEHHLVKARDLSIDIADSVFDKVLAKLKDFRGDSTFITWSNSFVYLTTIEIVDKRLLRDNPERWLNQRHKEVNQTQKKLRLGEEVDSNKRRERKKIEVYGEACIVEDENNEISTEIIDTRSQSPEGILLKEEDIDIAFNKLKREIEDMFEGETSERTNRNKLLITIMLDEYAKYELGDGNLFDTLPYIESTDDDQHLTFVNNNNNDNDDEPQIDNEDGYYKTSKEFMGDKVTDQRIADRYNELNPSNPITSRVVNYNITKLLTRIEDKKTASTIKDIFFEVKNLHTLSNYDLNNATDPIFKVIAESYNRRADVRAKYYNKQNPDKKNLNPRKFDLSNSKDYQYLKNILINIKDD